MSICGCWDNIVRLSMVVKAFAEALGTRNWKEAREKLPQVEAFLEKLEECSGIRFLGARARLEAIKREMARYDWVRAWADAESLMNEIIYDIGCRRVPIK